MRWTLRLFCYWVMWQPKVIPFNPRTDSLPLVPSSPRCTTSPPPPYLGIIPKKHFFYCLPYYHYYFLFWIIIVILNYQTSFYGPWPSPIIIITFSFVLSLSFVLSHLALSPQTIAPAICVLSYICALLHALAKLVNLIFFSIFVIFAFIVTSSWSQSFRTKINPFLRRMLDLFQKNTKYSNIFTFREITDLSIIWISYLSKLALTSSVT